MNGDQKLVSNVGFGSEERYTGRNDPGSPSMYLYWPSSHHTTDTRVPHPKFGDELGNDRHPATYSQQWGDSRSKELTFYSYYFYTGGISHQRSNFVKVSLRHKSSYHICDRNHICGLSTTHNDTREDRSYRKQWWSRVTFSERSMNRGPFPTLTERIIVYDQDVVCAMDPIGSWHYHG